MDQKPPKDFFTRLLQLGSSQYISGLFLELAKRQNNLLQAEAKEMLEGDIKWADENYAKGLRRCIRIYLTSIDEELKTERIQWIRNNLYKMDLPLTRLNIIEFKNTVQEAENYGSYEAYADQLY
ncbi:MAG: hypothetical protein GX370_09495 [Clostridia bacterium]|nr:hypothetical protein [Clostridia bacterium]